MPMRSVLVVVLINVFLPTVLLLLTGFPVQLSGISASWPRPSMEEKSYTLDVPSGLSRTDQVIDPLATSMAVYFSRFQLPPGDAVTVRSPDRRIAFEYHGDNSGGFLSGRIPGSQVIIEYQAAAFPAARAVASAAAAAVPERENHTFGYHINKYVRGVAAGRRTESVVWCGGTEDNSKPAKCFVNKTDPLLPHAYEKAQSVARLLINSTFVCTGWLVGSQGHLVTSNQCIATPAQAAHVKVEFHAESKSCQHECKEFLACPGQIVATSLEFVVGNAKLDYTMLQLVHVDVDGFNASTNASYPYRRFLQVRATGPVVGEHIYIPQYPQGGAKRISSVLRNGQAAQIHTLGGTTSCGKNQVGFAADTQPGSSGAPLISTKDNAVVALVHHCGGGCENTAVDVMDIMEDMATKNVVVKDFFAPMAAPDTAATSTTTTATATSPPPVATVSAPTMAFTNATMSTIQPASVAVKTTAPIASAEARWTSMSPSMQQPSRYPTRVCSTLTHASWCKYSFWCEWHATDEKCHASDLFQRLANLLATTP